MLSPRPLTSTILSALLLLACDSRPAALPAAAPAKEPVVKAQPIATAAVPAETAAPSVAAPQVQDLAAIKATLKQTHGEAQAARIDRGVDQVMHPQVVL